MPGRGVLHKNRKWCGLQHGWMQLLRGCPLQSCFGKLRQGPSWGGQGPCWRNRTWLWDVRGETQEWWGQAGGPTAGLTSRQLYGRLSSARVLSRTRTGCREFGGGPGRGWKVLWQRGDGTPGAGFCAQRVQYCACRAPCAAPALRPQLKAYELPVLTFPPPWCLLAHRRAPTPSSAPPTKGKGPAGAYQAPPPCTGSLHQARQ